MDVHDSEKWQNGRKTKEKIRELTTVLVRKSSGFTIQQLFPKKNRFVLTR